MIITRSWLQEWIDIKDISTKEILNRLNSIGLEVAQYKKIEIPSKVVVGKVIECNKHPNADKLSVCKVDVGFDIKQIVCGAKNVAKDQFVPVALIGAVLPDNFEIKHASLRGVDSEGMICSSTEINLPKIEDGILVLDDSVGELKIGEELKNYEILNDEIIEIELTANRGDCLSIYGVARELAAAFNLPLKSVKDISFEKNEKIQMGIGRVLNIKHQDCDSNLIYKVFSNKEYENPLIVKIRLAFIEEDFKNSIEALGFYGTYSLGTVIRAYGYDIFKKDNEAIIEIKKDENSLDAVYDNKKVSIIGINQIEESKPTKDDEYFIIELSYINPKILAKNYYEASKNRKIETDWVYYRSSRGSNPNLKDGLDYFCYLIKKFSDIEIFSGTHEIINELEEKTINIDMDELSSLIGTEISKNEVVNILSKLDFSIIKSEDKNLVVKIPSFRHDIENNQDVAEECLRFLGIDKISPKPLYFKEKNRINDSIYDFKKRKNLKERAVSAGFYESVSYIFTDKDKLKKYGFKIVKDSLDLLNPITKDLNTLRTSLVPNLLDQIINNLKNRKNSVRLYEIGTIFDENRKERLSFCLIFSGIKEQDSISNHGKPKEIDFDTFVKKISSIIGDFDLEVCEVKNRLMHPYQSAKIVKDDIELGYIYKLHLEYQKELEIPVTYICELDFDKIPFKIKEAKEYSKFQISFKDLSILIDKDINFSKIKEILKDFVPKEVKRFYPIDIYESKDLKDKKSLTIRFVIQSDEKTLNEEEISKIIDEILNLLKIKIGAELR